MQPKFRPGSIFTVQFCEEVFFHYMCDQFKELPFWNIILVLCCFRCRLAQHHACYSVIRPYNIVVMRPIGRITAFVIKPIGRISLAKFDTVMQNTSSPLPLLTGATPGRRWLPVNSLTGHTVTSWLFENSGLWRVECHSSWWDWVQGLFIWSLNGDNLPRSCWPSVSNL